MNGQRIARKCVSSNDIRLIDFKEFNIENRRCKVYRFKEDENYSSNSIRFSYYAENLGFIIMLDYYEDKYTRID